MSFLLDTNVVSEWVRPRPDAGVVAWLAEADEERVFISVVTLAELRHGIDRLAAGQRRRRLDLSKEPTGPRECTFGSVTDADGHGAAGGV